MLSGLRLAKYKLKKKSSKLKSKAPRESHIK